MIADSSSRESVHLDQWEGRIIETEKGVDALYIRLLEGLHQCRNVRLTDDIALDFAAGEKLVGIEILGASPLFEKPDAPAIDLKDVLPRMVAS